MGPWYYAHWEDGFALTQDHSFFFATIRNGANLELFEPTSWGGAEIHSFPSDG